MLHHTSLPHSEVAAVYGLAERDHFDCQGNFPRSGDVFCEPDQPVVVPSIAEIAGFSRFVYLVGRSRQRYVFSSVRKHRISLYYGAVFAVFNDSGTGRLWAGDYFGLVALINSGELSKEARIFVHLLAEGHSQKHDIVSDLTCWTG